jgi:hypothetical protein
MAHFPDPGERWEDDALGDAVEEWRQDLVRIGAVRPLTRIEELLALEAQEWAAQLPPEGVPGILKRILDAMEPDDDPGREP